MSARAIPAHLEAEVVAKNREGLSLRAIAAWLQETHAISASREAVSGVLHRHNVSPSALADSELVRAVSTRIEEVVGQLVECMSALRALREEPFTPETKPRISTHLRILTEVSRIALGLLRGVGRRTPRPSDAARPPNRSVAVANRTIDVATAAAEATFDRIERNLAPPAAPTPPRNRPCPCGSGKKWKVCCGSPKHAAPKAASAPLRTGL